MSLEMMAESGLNMMRQIDRRIVGHLAKPGSTDRSAAVMRIPASEYVDPVRFEREIEVLFRQRPIIACLSCDIPNPGDIFLFDELGLSLILTRTKKGDIKAYLNMCTHRGARLVDSCVSRSRFTCPFHAWSFDLDGKLIGLPDKESFSGLEREERKLVEIPVSEAHGVVFIKPCINSDPIDLEASLGDFRLPLSQLDLDTARHIKTDRVLVSANWKYLINTYGESYHFAALHPSSFAVIAHSNVMTYTSYSPHFRVNYALKTYSDIVELEEKDWPPRQYGGVHLSFPNTIINSDQRMGDNRFVTMFKIYPIDVDTSVTYFSTYRIGASEESDTEYETLHDATVQIVSTEDYSISERGHFNLKQVPADFEFVLGRNEVALQDFHQNIAAALAG
jgi:phenylpropionate dioxygenase-like ring-hydroxylating dioxygenase large terminal subunit